MSKDFPQKLSRFYTFEDLARAINLTFEAAPYGSAGIVYSEVDLIENLVEALKCAYEWGYSDCNWELTNGL